MKKTVLPILVSTVWISISEFARNETFLKPYWTEHYASLGLEFPSDPANGAAWGLWALLFSIGIYILSKRFSFWETVGVAWLMGFVLMWVVTGNMMVLPFAILWYAVPLSVLEVFLSVLIFKKMGQ